MRTAGSDRRGVRVSAASTSFGPDFRLDRESVDVASRVIGPVRVGDRLATLRPPRISDGPAWRATCLREEARLKDSFGAPGVPWSTSVSLVSWADRVMQQRASAKAGLLVPYVVTYDNGAVAGEISFAIDPRTATAEVSLWITKETPKALRTWLIGMSMLRIFSLPQPIERVVAPVAVGNPGPTQVFTLLGFTKQATARELRAYGGAVVDHDIWWLDRSDDLIGDFGRVLATSGGTA